jgi:hypothetical protein
MARSYVLGLDCKVYYLVGAPTDYATDQLNLVEICVVQDATLSMSAATADATSRCSGGWRATVQSLRDANPSISSLWRPSDAGLAILMDTFLTGGTIAMAFLDNFASQAAVPTSERITGLYSLFSVTDFSRSEPLEEVVTADFELQNAPTDPTTQPLLPEWVDVAGTLI